jgi:hypothetical protein
LVSRSRSILETGASVHVSKGTIFRRIPNAIQALDLVKARCGCAAAQEEHYAKSAWREREVFKKINDDAEYDSGDIHDGAKPAIGPGNTAASATEGEKQLIAANSLTRKGSGHLIRVYPKIRLFFPSLLATGKAQSPFFKTDE